MATILETKTRPSLLLIGENKLKSEKTTIAPFLLLLLLLRSTIPSAAMNSYQRLPLTEEGV